MDHWRKLIILASLNRSSGQKVYLLEDRRRTLQDASFRVLKEIVRGWIGRDSILLKAEQLSSGAGYGWTAGKNTLNGKPSAYVEEYKDLGYPNDDG